MDRDKMNLRKFLFLIVVLGGFVFALVDEAKAAYCGDFAYVVDKNTQLATITSYRGNDQAISIPREVDGYKVVNLDHGLFENSKKIKSVSIPSTVKIIQSRVFYKNINLKTVNIPDSVTELGREAFYGCSSLESVTIGKGVKTIHYGTFANCDRLSEVNLSEGLQIIAGSMDVEGAFANCTALTQIRFPNTLKSISWYAFDSCWRLKEVYIPDSVTTIREYAFARCSGLEKISIGKGIKEIPAHMLQNCKKLHEVIFRGDDVNRIKTLAFENCIALEEIVMPNNLDEIELCAFAGCTNIKSIKLNEGLTRIADQAFKDCISMEEIIIPSSVIDFIGNVFSGCKNLKTVYLKANLSNSYGNPFVNIGCEDDTLLIKAYSNNEFLKKMHVKDDDLRFKVEYIEAIPSRDITFAQESITLQLGESVILPAGMTPVESTDSIIYKVGNKNVATVNQRGKITAVGYGGTTITARTNSNTVTQLKVYVRPKKVTGFKDAAIGIQTIKLQWNEQENVDGYYVYKKEGGKWKNIKNVISKSSEDLNVCFITNLPSGTTHQFAINAYKVLNGKRYISSTFPVVTTFTLPSKVTNFKKSSSTRTTIKTTWKKVNGASGYVVYRYQNKKWVRLSVTNKNYYTYKNLSRNTSYKLCIKPYKKVGSKIGYGSITTLTSRTSK